MHIRSRNRCAFTLIELLVVVAIIGLLMSILVPSLARVRTQGRRAKCRSNLRQIMLATEHRAYDHKGVYMPFTSIESDSFEHIYPQYLPDYRLALCPSTRNKIRFGNQQELGGRGSLVQPTNEIVLADLQSAAAHAQDDDGGHSYEIFGFFSGPALYPNGRKIQGATTHRIREILGLRPIESGNLIKLQQTVHSASRTLLLVDSDQHGGGSGNLHNNYPDPLNNHGEEGVNMAFCDGHVEWIDTPRLGRAYRASNQGKYFAVDNHQLTGEPLDPGLVITTVSIAGKAFTRYSYSDE